MTKAHSLWVAGWLALASGPTAVASDWLDDPFGQSLPHAWPATDLAAVLHPFGLSPDLLGYTDARGVVSNPYALRALRGGAVSQYHGQSGQVTQVFDVRTPGLLGTVQYAEPAPARRDRITLEVSPLWMRATARQPLGPGGDRLHLRLGRSTADAWDTARFPTPHMTDAGVWLDLEPRAAQLQVGGTSRRESLHGTAGRWAGAFQGLALQTNHRHDGLGWQVRPRRSGWQPRQLGVTGTTDRDAATLLDSAGRRVLWFTARSARWRWNAEWALGRWPARLGATTTFADDDLRWARDDVPLHRFASPDSLVFHQRWHEVTAYVRLEHTVADQTVTAGLALSATDRARGVSPTVELGWRTARQRWSGHATLFRRTALPGAAASLSRGLAIQLDAAAREVASGFTGGLAFSEGLQVTLHWLDLDPTWVPAERRTFRAVAGSARAWGAALVAERRLGWAPLIARGRYAYAHTQLAGGAYGDRGHPPADLRHRGSAALILAATRSWQLEATLTAQSGLPVTPVVARVAAGGEVLAVSGAPGSARLPHTVRADLGVKTGGRWPWAAWRARVELLNLAGRLNPAAWHWNDSFTERRTQGMLPRTLYARLELSWPAR